MVLLLEVVTSLVPYQPTRPARTPRQSADRAISIGFRSELSYTHESSATSRFKLWKVLGTLADALGTAPPY